MFVRVLTKGVIRFSHCPRLGDAAVTWAIGYQPADVGPIPRGTLSTYQKSTSGEFCQLSCTLWPPAARAAANPPTRESWKGWRTRRLPTSTSGAGTARCRSSGGPDRFICTEGVCGSLHCVPIDANFCAKTVLSGSIWLLNDSVFH